MAIIQQRFGVMVGSLVVGRWNHDASGAAYKTLDFQGFSNTLLLAV